jgi:peroxiredoxin
MYIDNVTVYQLSFDLPFAMFWTKYKGGSDWLTVIDVYSETSS